MNPVDALRRVEQVCTRFERSSFEERQDLGQFLTGTEGEERVIPVNDPSKPPDRASIVAKPRHPIPLGAGVGDGPIMIGVDRRFPTFPTLLVNTPP